MDILKDDDIWIAGMDTAISQLFAVLQHQLNALLSKTPQEQLSIVYATVVREIEAVMSSFRNYHQSSVLLHCAMIDQLGSPLCYTDMLSNGFVNGSTSRELPTEFVEDVDDEIRVHFLTTEESTLQNYDEVAQWHPDEPYLIAETRTPQSTVMAEHSQSERQDVEDALSGNSSHDRPATDESSDSEKRVAYLKSALTTISDKQSHQDTQILYRDGVLLSSLQQAISNTGEIAGSRGGGNASQHIINDTLTSVPNSNVEENLLSIAIGNQHRSAMTESQSFVVAGSPSNTTRPPKIITAITPKSSEAMFVSSLGIVTNDDRCESATHSLSEGIYMNGDDSTITTVAHAKQSEKTTHKIDCLGPATLNDVLRKAKGLSPDRRALPQTKHVNGHTLRRTQSSRCTKALIDGKKPKPQPTSLGKCEDAVVLDAIPQLQSLFSQRFLTLHEPQVIFGALLAALDKKNLGQALALTRLFYAIGSSEAFYQLQQSIMQARNSHVEMSLQMDDSIRNSVISLDRLDVASFRSHILRRYHLVRLLEFRVAVQNQLEHHKKRRRTRTKSKYDLRNIDALCRPVDGKDINTPPQQMFRSRYQARSDTLALQQMMRVLYPDCCPHEEAEQSPSSTYNRNLERLKSRLACARTWYQMRKSFNTGILALIPSGSRVGISIDQVEKLPIAAVKVFLDLLRGRRGDFLLRASQSLVDQVFDILEPRSSSSSGTFKFELLSDKDLLNLDGNEDELLIATEFVPRLV